MAFALTETEEKEIKMQQKQAKREKDIVEHIELSVLLFLNAKAAMTLIGDGLGIDIVSVSKYIEKYKKAKNLSEYLETHYDKIKHKKRLTEEEIKTLKKQLDSDYYTTCRSMPSLIKKKFGKDFTPNRLRFSLKNGDMFISKLK